MENSAASGKIKIAVRSAAPFLAASCRMERWTLQASSGRVHRHLPVHRVSRTREGGSMQAKLRPAIVCMAIVFCAAGSIPAQQNPPLTAAPTQEGDFVARDFKFSDGQSLPEVRLHYTAMGTPRRDRNDQVTNHILGLH